MSDMGIVAGGDRLRDAAVGFLKQKYHGAKIAVETSIHKDLRWSPTLYFKASPHLIHAYEVSDTLYPEIFRIRRNDLADFDMPISAYAICAEERFLADQKGAQELFKHGFGLLTVDADSVCLEQRGCIPLMQRISEDQFKSELAGIPTSLKRRMSDAFDLYGKNAPAGVTQLSEIIEGLILQAGRDAAKKTWISNNQAQPGKPAVTLDAFIASQQMKDTAAVAGGVRSHIAQYRNTSHHFPKNAKQAALKYRDCRHGFLDGVKQVKLFAAAMKAKGLSGKIPTI